MKFQLYTIAILCVIHTATAFTPSWTHIFKGGIGGNNFPPPPPSGTSHHNFFEDGDDSLYRNNMLAASFMGMLDTTEDVISLPELSGEEEQALDVDLNSDSVEGGTEYVKDLRGGSTKSSSTNDVVAGAKSSMQTTVSYWSHAVESFKGKVKNTFSRNKKKWWGGLWC